MYGFPLSKSLLVGSVHSKQYSCGICFLRLQRRTEPRSLVSKFYVMIEKLIKFNINQYFVLFKKVAKDM